MLMRSFVSHLLLALYLIVITGNSISFANDKSSSITSSFSISVHTDLVTASVAQTLLPKVLDSLSDQTGITVSMDIAVLDEPISAQFKNLPLDEAVHRLLQGLNYSLIYDKITTTEGQSTRQLVEVHVLSDEVEWSSDINHDQTELKALANTFWTSINDAEYDELLGAMAEHDFVSFTQLFGALWSAFDLETGAQNDPLLQQQLIKEIFAEIAMSNSDPQLRASALELLSELEQDSTDSTSSSALSTSDDGAQQAGAQQALNEVATTAIMDEDSVVRAAALTVIEDVEQASAQVTDQINQMALTDPIPELRAEALDLVVALDQENALTTLTDAINDPDPLVSELATELLQELKEGGELLKN